MAHKISLDYKHTGTSEQFNNFGYNIIPNGLYTDVTLVKVSDISVNIPTLTAFISDSVKELSVRIENDATEALAINNTIPYIIARLTWVNSVANDFTFIAINLGGILSTDVVLGKANFSGSTLVDFDYTVQSLSPLRNNGDDVLKINLLDEVTTPTTSMEYLIEESGVSKKITHDNLRTSINTSGAGVPASTPDYVGQIYVDTTNNKHYYAIDTSGSTDWIVASLNGAGVPATTPDFIGQTYVNTTSNDLYYSKGVASSADWIGIILSGILTKTIVDTGWINNNDWTNRHIGSPNITYGTLVGGPFTVGEIVTGGTSTATGIIETDNGSNLMVVNNCTNGGNFTSAETITGTDSGATAVVSANTKNVDTNFYHGFGFNLTDMSYRVRIFTSSDGTEANAVEMGLGNTRTADHGLAPYAIDTNNIKYQIGSSGLASTQDSGTTLTISTQDWYYKIIAEDLS